MNLLGLVSLASLALLISGGAWASAPLVRTDSGAVQGKKNGELKVFLGIPYAAPPVGALRWSAPKKPAPWTKPFKATSLGPACLQPKSFGSPETVGSEDCLSLNVWAPESATPLPVMFFIHGGFYVYGSSDESYSFGNRIHDGQKLAEKGHVVVVSVNYRLGPLGFFAHTALDDGSPESHSGNFGLFDQVAALDWVKRNIAAFGGDPARVTVFGQSAGASSILGLMASPRAEGLFARAIVESGYLKAVPRARALEQSSTLAAATGCASPLGLAECLRGLPGTKVALGLPPTAEAGKENIFVPNQDGWFFPEPLETAYREGRVRQIPVILGTNADEVSNLVTSLYGPPIKTDAEFEERVVRSYGQQMWERVRSTYSLPSLGTPEERLIQLGTDGIFTCPVSRVARWLAAGQGSDVRRYIFSRTLPLPGVGKLGAAHGFEMLYIFGSFPSLLSPLVPGADRDLSKEMMSTWARFASGDPATYANGQAWPRFETGSESAVEFMQGSRVVQAYRADRCRAIDAEAR
jgi:para-nitrobenzyl esterase